MNSIDYIGFDIHKKTISFCAKAQDGRILDEGIIPARRTDLSAWAKRRSRPLVGRDGSDVVLRDGFTIT
jgi:transposase